MLEEVNESKESKRSNCSGSYKSRTFGIFEEVNKSKESNRSNCSGGYMNETSRTDAQGRLKELTRLTCLKELTGLKEQHTTTQTRHRQAHTDAGDGRRR